MSQITRGGRSLHLFGTLALGGAETWIVQALESRRDARWTADFCLLGDEEGPYVERVRALGSRVLRCPYRPAATFARRLRRLLEAEGYDAVHSHVLLFSGVTLAAAAAAGVPLRAAHAHNASDGRANSAARACYRALMRRSIARSANLVVACSREAARAFGAAGERAEILPYGIDLRPFRNPANVSRAEFGFPAETRILAAVGRLHPQKNYEFLLDAFSLASMARPELRLVVAGEGDLRPRLEARIAEPDLAGKVRLLGARSDIPALLAGAADAFVMPSLHEGLPLALLEAQAAGLPCLLSNEISREAVVIGAQVERLGLDEDWPAALADLADRSRFEAREAVRRMRAAGFDAADSWARVETLYDEALAEAAASPRAEAA